MLWQRLRLQLVLALQTHLSRMVSVYVARGKIPTVKAKLTLYEVTFFFIKAACMKSVSELQPLLEHS